MIYMERMGRLLAFGVLEFMIPGMCYERWEANVDCMAGSSRLGTPFVITRIVLLRVLSGTRDAVCKISTGNFSPRATCNTASLRVVTSKNIRNKHKNISNHCLYVA